MVYDDMRTGRIPPAAGEAFPAPPAFCAG